MAHFVQQWHEIRRRRHAFIKFSENRLISVAICYSKRWDLAAEWKIGGSPFKEWGLWDIHTKGSRRQLCIRSASKKNRISLTVSPILMMQNMTKRVSCFSSTSNSLEEEGNTSVRVQGLYLQNADGSESKSLLQLFQNLSFRLIYTQLAKVPGPRSGASGVI